MPQKTLKALQFIAETTIEVERKYQNLSQKWWIVCRREGMILSVLING